MTPKRIPLSPSKKASTYTPTPRKTPGFEQNVISFDHCFFF